MWKETRNWKGINKRSILNNCFVGVLIKWVVGEHFRIHTIDFITELLLYAGDLYSRFVSVLFTDKLCKNLAYQE